MKGLHLFIRNIVIALCIVSPALSLYTQPCVWQDQLLLNFGLPDSLTMLAEVVLERTSKTSGGPKAEHHTTWPCAWHLQTTLGTLLIVAGWWKEHHMVCIILQALSQALTLVVTQNSQLQYLS